MEKAKLMTLQWRLNECDGVSNHRPLDCVLNRLFRRRSKKTSKLRVTGLCEGNPLVTGGFPSQRASNAKNVSIWWRHHEINAYLHVKCIHDAWSWWRHQMETFSALLALCEGNKSVICPSETLCRSLWRHCNVILSTVERMCAKGQSSQCIWIFQISNLFIIPK